MTENKSNKFRCANCDGVFTKKWSDEEAQAELAERFPNRNVEDCAIVCDDCYKLMGFGK